LTRAFLVVMDSVGIGGAPDAGDFVSGGVPDTGANTLAHIAQARAGGLHLPNLDTLGLGAALRLASGQVVPGLGTRPTGLWGAAIPKSAGKDTPSGHWDLAGVPLRRALRQFPDREPAFPDAVVSVITNAAGTGGILGNCHASGTEIVARLGAEHLRSRWPICYTSADSVLQIAAHEQAFGLARLLALCAAIAPMMHAMNVCRVIARPFTGSTDTGFVRTANRRDFAMPPPDRTLCDWVGEAGRTVHAIGKIGDIFSMRGIDTLVKGSDAELMAHLQHAVERAEPGSLTFANFVEFDSLYGHRRDVQGYAGALEWFDAALGPVLTSLGPGDMMLITADHGNDPTWPGTDHTRECVPVLIAGGGRGSLGLLNFGDVAACVAAHLGVRNDGPGTNALPRD
jgi:phosphopentomutase